VRRCAGALEQDQRLLAKISVPKIRFGPHPASEMGDAPNSKLGHITNSPTSRPVLP
jgi:hypothetical protein